MIYQWCENMCRLQSGDKNSDKNDESISCFDTTLLEC